MPVAYPGPNPSQAWANSLVDAINAMSTGYQQWTGTIASAVALTASNFHSLLMSTAVEFTGVGTPDLVLSWNGDCFSVPQDGHYEVMLQATFDNVGTGNRYVGLKRNPTGNTVNSGSITGAWMRGLKFGPTSDTASGFVIWKGWLTTTDRVMPVVRSTSAVDVLASAHETALSVTFLRSAR